MIVRAHLRYLRIAPRKVRLVIDLVRGLTVAKALDQLSVLPKRSATPVTKLILSAVANAKHNFQLDEKTLVVKAITANEGPRLKRYMPRAFGRAGEILKRTTHITVELEGQEIKGAKPMVKKEAKPEHVKLTDVKRAPAARPKASTKTAKPKSDNDKLKEHAGHVPVIPRQGTD